MVLGRDDKDLREQMRVRREREGGVRGEGDAGLEERWRKRERERDIKAARRALSCGEK